MKRKAISIIVLILVLMSVIGVVIMITNPLLRSEEKIREKLLETTPIGTKMEDVIKLVERNEKWEVARINYERGFWHQRIYPNRTVGKKSIQVELGEYRFILITSVTVYFGFDENSELIDVWVWKTTDSF